MWWHLARHTFPTTRTTVTERLADGLAGALAGGLAGALAGGLVGGLVGTLAGAVAGWLTVTLVLFGLAFGLQIGLEGRLGSGSAAPRHIDLRLRGRVTELLSSLAFGLMAGLILGPVAWFMGWAMIGLAGGQVWLLPLAGPWAFWLGGGCAFGLTFGLALGLMDFLASASIAQRSTSPMTSYRGNWTWVAIACFLFGLIAGLTVGLAVGLAFGLMVGLAVGLAVGLTNEAWPTFLLASGWLAIRRRFPWRLMTFLEDAYRLGLLRVVGLAYQFRHAELQDHLAPQLGHANPMTRRS